MKIPPPSIFSRYLASWWAPTLIACIALLSYALDMLASWFRPPRGLLAIPAEALSITLHLTLGASLLGLLAAVIWNFRKGRWLPGLANLLLGAATACVTALFFGLFMLATMHGPSEDHFADNLKIPTNTPVAEPHPQREAAPGGPTDTFQAALLGALQTKGGDDPRITAKLDAVFFLQKTAPAILQRYLVTSPAWRVSGAFGRRYATRRWMIGSHWQSERNGYYTRFSVDKWSQRGIPEFQTRLLLGLSGKPQWADRHRTTCLQPGETAPAILSEGNQQRQSHCVIKSDGLAVEIFEQSSDIERRLTKATLASLETDLRPLAASPDQATLLRILPPGSIRHGLSVLELSAAGGSGTYRTELWVHASEPGSVYLKAFEVTQGTPLSTDFLKMDSTEELGWSDDPDELFFSDAVITIGEGDPGKPYAARFEVWFAPASGQAERKLFEKVFKIEGYKF